MLALCVVWLTLDPGASSGVTCLAQLGVAPNQNQINKSNPVLSVKFWVRESAGSKASALHVADFSLISGTTQAVPGINS